MPPRTPSTAATPQAAEHKRAQSKKQAQQVEQELKKAEAVSHEADARSGGRARDVERSDSKRGRSGQAQEQEQQPKFDWETFEARQKKAGDVRAAVVTQQQRLLRAVLCSALSGASACSANMHATSP